MNNTPPPPHYTMEATTRRAHLLAATPANHSDVLVCLKYDSENLPLSLDFTDKAPTSKLFGPAQQLPSIVDGVSLHPTIYEAFATQNPSILPTSRAIRSCRPSTMYCRRTRIAKDCPSFLPSKESNIHSGRRSGTQSVRSTNGIRRSSWRTRRREWLRTASIVAQCTVAALALSALILPVHAVRI